MAMSQIGAKEIIVVGVFVSSFLFAAYSLLFLRPIIGFEVLFGCAFFLICFLNMEAGLVLFFLGILFSPEISLGDGFVGGSRPIVARFEDFLIIVCGMGWVARIAILREYKLFRYTPLNWPITAFVSLCVLSTLHGVGTGYVAPQSGFLFVLKYTQYFLVFLLVANYVRTYEQIKKLLVAAIIVVMLFCAYAYYQIPSVQIFTSNRISAPFSHEAESTSIGGILVFVMAILLSMLLFAKKLRHKIWCGVGIAAAFLPFLYTLSRTSYMAFLFMLLMVVVYSRNRILIFLTIIFLFLSPIVLPHQVLDRIAYTWRDAREYGVDPSSQERLLVWRKIFIPLTDSPFTALFGFGVSAFDILDNQYVRNIFEVGLLGLAAFLWILARIYKTAYFIYANTRIRWIKGFTLGYIAGYWGLIFHGLGAITFTMVRPMEMFWFLTGIIFVYASIMEKVEPELVQKNPDMALPAR